MTVSQSTLLLCISDIVHSKEIAVNEAQHGTHTYTDYDELDLLSSIISHEYDKDKMSNCRLYNQHNSILRTN